VLRQAETGLGGMLFIYGTTYSDDSTAYKVVVNREGQYFMLAYERMSLSSVETNPGNREIQLQGGIRSV